MTLKNGNSYEGVHMDNNWNGLNKVSVCMCVCECVGRGAMDLSKGKKSSAVDLGE